jgi:hypothetical protein
MFRQVQKKSCRESDKVEFERHLGALRSETSHARPASPSHGPNFKFKSWASSATRSSHLGGDRPTDRPPLPAAVASSLLVSPQPLPVLRHARLRLNAARFAFALSLEQASARFGLLRAGSGLAVCRSPCVRAATTALQSSDRPWSCSHGAWTHAVVIPKVVRRSGSRARQICDNGTRRCAPPTRSPACRGAIFRRAPPSGLACPVPCTDTVLYCIALNLFLSLG